MMFASPVACFRYEASLQIGAGHAMRCAALAEGLIKKGWQCYLVMSEQTYNFLPHHQNFIRIDPDLFWMNPFKHNLLIIDHYELDIAYEKHFRLYVDKILVIDDLASRQHDCDILLDQTFGRNVKDYQELVPENCTILVGSEYTLLRTEFAEARFQALAKRQNTREIKKIFISMGGSDPNNYTLSALEWIKCSNFLGDIDIVLGFSAPHFETVQAFTKFMKNNISIYRSSNRMAQLICDADLAICAAGSSAWERACLGLPTVLIKTADNQKYVS